MNDHLINLIINSYQTFIETDLYNDKKSLLSCSLFFTIILAACSSDDEIGVERPGYTYIPDDQLEQWLMDKSYDDKLDNYILTANAKTIDRLCADEYSINDFTGLEDFTSLEYLCVYWGEFTSIDLSKNINLIYLTLQGKTRLSTIDLTNNKKLQFLDLWGNSFTDIDLSQNTELRYINLSSNELTSFNPQPFKN